MPCASEILATNTRGFAICFSALLFLKDYPGEAVVQEDPSRLLEDSRRPKGNQCTAAALVFVTKLIN